MSLLEEFNSLKKEWKNSSLTFKIITCISFFFTVSSLASLSDVVFHWKNFFLDGIEFYRSYVRKPITNLICYLGLNIQGYSTDLCILLLTLATPFFRVYYAVFKKYKERKARIQTFALTLLYFLIILFFFIHLGNMRDLSITVALIIGASLLSIPILFYFLDKKWFIKMYSPVLLAIILVLILGAISKGLSK